jgi:tryptophan synthase beta chain
MTVASTKGKFGPYGGQYVPETLMPVLAELEDAYAAAQADPAFWQELHGLLRDYVGRPSPLYLAERLGERVGCRVYLKREDLNHTGSHKINNTLGQALLCRRMGKSRMIAETGAGQHGVATATVAALFGFECVVYMGEEDIRRQAPNVHRMRLLGTEVRSVTSGTRTLKDAINEAFRDWMAHPAGTFYCFGTVSGPHPFPTMVRDFQSVIGREAREQILEREGRLPTMLLACVGGGSNAMGLFHCFVPDEEVALIGVEAAGAGVSTGMHAASLSAGSPGVIHGAATYLLQDGDGQVLATHSAAAGLDYPGVGPEHAYLKDAGRSTYVSVTDRQALDAMVTLSRLEGIIPALESAHAVAHLLALADAGEIKPDDLAIVNVSGRGDKDLDEVLRLLGEEVAL